MTQENLRDSAWRLSGLARATLDKELRIRYLEEALMLAQKAEELYRIPSVRAAAASPDEPRQAERGG